MSRIGHRQPGPPAQLICCVVGEALLPRFGYIYRALREGTTCTVPRLIPSHEYSRLKMKSQPLVFFGVDERPYHLLIYVLTVDTPIHSRLRCYQRAALAAFGVQPGGHLQVDTLRTAQIVYVLHDRGEAASAESRREAATLRDVLLLPASQTCLGKVIAALRHLERSSAKYDGVLFTDDDALLHPQRLVLDMAQFAAASHLVMGIVSWGAYWDERSQKHVGYANRAEEITTKLVKAWERVSPKREWQGPFPFPNGFHMGLTRGTITAMNHALRDHPRLRALRAYLDTKAPTTKCDPEPDSGLGYILAHVPAEVPLTTVDLTSAQRVHFWRTRATEQALHNGLSILHAAKNWSDHFAWAACEVSRLHARGNLTSRGHRCYRGYPQLSHACHSSGRCPPHFDPILSQSRTWCSADLTFSRLRRRPPLARVESSICESRPPSCDYVLERQAGLKALSGRRTG